MNGQVRSNPAEPTATVVVLNYNYAPFVVESLESVRAQTFADLELVVIDDGSTDGSREIIDRWLDEHWPDATRRLHTENRGLLARANEGLALAQGRYYQLFSTDDRMEPHKIALQVDVLERRPETALCFSDMRRIDGKGELVDGTVMETTPQEIPPGSGRMLARVYTRAPFCAPSWLLRRQAVEAVGGYDERFYTEDIQLLFKLGARYDFAYVDEPLVDYRWHGTNTSSRFESTPAHRLAWCELLRAIADEPDVEERWRALYRERVRALVVGNPRRESLPHARFLTRRALTAANLAVLAGAECGICDARARRVIAWRESVARGVRRCRVG